MCKRTSPRPHGGPPASVYSMNARTCSSTPRASCWSARRLANGAGARSTDRIDRTFGSLGAGGKKDYATGVGQSLFCQACALHIANRKCRVGVELLRRVVLRALSTMFLFAGSPCVLAGQPEHDVPCVNTGTSCIALNPNVTPATIA